MGGGQGFCLWRLRHTFRAPLQLLWEQPVIKIKIIANQENRPSQPASLLSYKTPQLSGVNPVHPTLQVLEASIV